MKSILALLRSLFNRILAFFRRLSGSDDDIVVYYGCPNSKTAKKLQLDKKRCR